MKTCHTGRAGGTGRALRLLAPALLAGVGLSGAGIAAALQEAAPPSPAQLPDGPGRALVQQACTQCHALEVVIAQGRTPDNWAEIVQTMIGNGAPLDDAQAKTVTAFLAQHFPEAAGPGTAPKRPGDGA